MAAVDKSVRTFQELATRYDQIGEAQIRDRFLVLAAEAALSAGRLDEAESIRGRLLQVNPHHLLKPYASLSQAMQSPDVKSYVDGLRRTYPREQAEQMLESIRAGGTQPEKADVPAASPTFPPFKASDAGKTEPAKVKDAAAKPVLAKVDMPLEKPAPPAVPLAPPNPPTPQEPLREAPIPFAADFVPPAPTNTPAPARAETPRSKTEGNLLVTGLFLLVLAVATGLAVYTLLKPFL